jgi:hypothetical protein
MNGIIDIDMLNIPAHHAQYQVHAEERNRPCNCFPCLIKFVVFGGAFVAFEDGAWAPVMCDGKVKGVSAEKLRNIFTDDHGGDIGTFASYVIDEGIRALPRNVNSVIFHTEAKKRKALAPKKTKIVASSNTMMSASSMMPLSLNTLLNDRKRTRDSSSSDEGEGEG